MTLRRPRLALVFFVALASLPARAESPRVDPLRLVPSQADAFVEVRDPRKLIEAGAALEVVQALRRLPPVQEALDSTNARRFRQLVAYFEKKLNTPWPEMLDKLAGHGAVLAVKFDKDPAPVLLVVQGRDEKLMSAFLAAAVDVIDEELARQEAKDRVRRRTYRDCEAVSVGTDFHAARVGSALLVGNKEVALKAAIDLAKDGGDASLARSPAVAEARSQQPADPLAWAWVSLEQAKQNPQAKEIFSSPRDNAILTVLFGGWIDVLARSPFVTAALTRNGQEVRATFQAPRGRKGSSADLLVHAPPAGEGLPPLLRPAGVLSSHSFYLDLGKFWDERTRLFNAAQVAQFEKADRDAGPFLAGARPSKLMTTAGPRHRFVVVNQPKAAYQRQPRQNLPAFALVSEMRQPDEFGPSAEAILRGAALLAGTQAKLKMTEEKVGSQTLVGYRFSEKGTLPQDTEDLRFNFSPCFARVGNQFLACSTLELGREMVGLLEKEAQGPAAKPVHAAMVSRVFGPGAAQALAQVRDTLVSQAVLGQAVPVEEARAQVDAFLDLVRRLGGVRASTTYGPNVLRHEIRLYSPQ